MFVNARLPGGARVDLPVVEGRFASVGGAEVDLEGAYVLPGLWDTHLHFVLWSLGLARLQLSACASREEVLASVRAWPGSFVVGQGWNESRWPDPAQPTSRELDEAGGGRPVVLFRADLHSAVASSAALALAGLSPESSPLVSLTGRVLESAVLALNAAIPAPSSAELEAALRSGASELHRLGVTGIVDQRMPEGEELPFSLYESLRLPLRISCNRAPGQAFPGPGNEWVRPGHVKLFSDGSMGSRTARMLAGYPGTADRGLWLTPPSELRPHFAGRSQRLSIHAIGDEALRVVLDLFEEHGVVPGDRIEHVQLLSDQDLPRLARLGLVASMQPVHLVDDQKLALELFGSEARTYYRLADLAACGTRLAFGSDAPVADPSPWLGLQAAVHRPASFFPEQRLSAAAALAAYTSEAAATLGWEGLGRLDPGSWADFIAVDRDPLTCEDYAQVQVLRTVVGGETVFRA